MRRVDHMEWSRVRDEGTRFRRVRPLMGLSAVLLLAATTPAVAQIPETFTNLQFYPEDISRGELIGEMRSFAGALGVRCNYCHVGEDPNDLTGYDFASDEKEVKRIARGMLTMRDEINGTFLAAMDRADPVEVQCATCHRGVSRPISLRDEMLTVVREDGVEAADARYRELREQYYGSAAYDFSQGSLNSATEALLREGNTEAALAIIGLNIEHNPDDDFPLMLQAQAQLAAGDREGAIESVERALELSPGNEFYQGQLERLRRDPF